MAVEPSAERQSGVARHLAGLVLASTLCVAILTLSLAARSNTTDWGVSPREMIVLAVFAGGFLFMSVAVALLLRALSAARRFEREAATEANHLRSDLASAEMVIQSEPSLVLAWDHHGNATILAHNLPGAPEQTERILRFRDWLTEASATDLKARLDTMFRTGDGATFTIRTASDAPIEAQCRVRGGRAYLKLRDAAGERMKFAELDQRYRMADESLADNRVLLDNLPMLVWYHDANDRIEWANRAYIAAVDATTLDEVLSSQLELLETRERQTLRNHTADRTPYHQRIHMIIHGERRAFDLIAIPLDNRTALFASDAAALELAEGELTRQSVANEGTLDRVSTAVAIFGQDQHLTFYNQAYATLWDLDPAWLDTKPKDTEILDRLRNNGALPDSGNYRKWRERLLDGYRSRTPMEDWWHLQGDRTIHLRAEPRPDGGMAYLYDDVTERLALERGYNELISVQGETLDNLAEGVAVFAPDGRLRLFNPSFARIWRLDTDGLEKQPHVEDVIQACQALYDAPTDWNQIHRAVATISDAREPVDGQMTRPDGSVIDYTCIPLPDSATLLTFIDVTDRSRVERALIERTEALEAADRLKNDFVSHVSYELRTPLTNIIGFSELLATPTIGALNDKQREYLGDIHTSSNTLLTIINDILDLATIDAGAFALTREAVQINDIVQGAVQAVHDKLNRAQIFLQVHIEPGLTEIDADENRMRQVLTNLLSNAIGFSRPGSKISLTCHKADTMVVFNVSDTGVGIPQDMHDKVFERFESNARGTNHRGAGLGLAIVKGLVELHGGTINLVSTPDQGTSITVAIPSRRAAQQIGETTPTGYVPTAHQAA